MITLKDIKVSKNRIPVQNAIWLRPIGGLAFKVYYPHGGDWQEIITTNSQIPPEEQEQEGITLEGLQELVNALSKRVDNVYRRLEIANSNISTTRENITRLSRSIYDLTEQVNTLNTAVDALYEGTQLPTSVELSSAFGNIVNPVDALPSDLEAYGLTELVLLSIERGVCTTATIAGDQYNRTIEVSSTGSRAQGNFVITLWSSPIPGTTSFNVYTITQGVGEGMSEDYVEEVRYRIEVENYM